MFYENKIRFAINYAKLIWRHIRNKVFSFFYKFNRLLQLYKNYPEETYEKFFWKTDWWYKGIFSGTAALLPLICIILATILGLIGGGFESTPYSYWTLAFALNRLLNLSITPFMRTSTAFDWKSFCFSVRLSFSVILSRFARRVCNILLVCSATELSASWLANSF